MNNLTFLKVWSLIMVASNLFGSTDISWWLVFIPAAVSYVFSLWQYLIKIGEKQPDEPITFQK